jgi:hypothetical protein
MVLTTSKACARLALRKHHVCLAFQILVKKLEEILEEQRQYMTSRVRVVCFHNNPRPSKSPLPIRNRQYPSNNVTDVVLPFGTEIEVLHWECETTQHLLEHLELPLLGGIGLR